MIDQLQGFDKFEFIQQYWQKKPCLINQAIPDFESPISPEELAGLACEDEVHSRLVLEKDGNSPWELSYGPFREEDFLALPETHYSLLVSECEKWILEVNGSEIDPVAVRKHNETVRLVVPLARTLMNMMYFCYRPRASENGNMAIVE